MNQRCINQFAGKLWIWCVVILMVSTTLFVVPVHAANQWSQYAKIGPVSNDLLGTFNTPNSVAVDSKGNVYVSDSENHRVQMLDASKGAWREWGKKGTGIERLGKGLGEFWNPAGIVVDSKDNVYVVDSNNRRIQKLDAVTKEWSLFGDSFTGYGFQRPRGIAIDSTGNVYVADIGSHLILKFDVTTGKWSYWGKGGSKTGSNLGEFKNPNGVAIDNSRNVLYVADSGNNRIQKLDLSTGDWSVAVSTAAFKNPKGVEINGNVLYVADSGNNRILKIDVISEEWSEWGRSGGMAGSNLGEFNHPTSVAIDKLGNVYVADSNNHRILKLTVTINEWNQWGYQAEAAGDDLGQFAFPVGVTSDSEGNVYVADYDNNRIQKRNVTTGEWSEWKNRNSNGEAGIGRGEFNSPTDIAVDSGGNIYVADRYNHRIQKFDVITKEWTEWKKDYSGPNVIDKGSGSAPGEFSIPGGVAVDRDGNVYVADTNNNRIQKLNVAEQKWSMWGKNGGMPLKPGSYPDTDSFPRSGSGLGEFKQPSGVEVDSNGNVYVADMGNNRIQKLDVSTGSWSDWGKSGGETGSNLGEFNEPFSVAVDSSGNVYAADMGNNRIQILDVSANKWSEWGKSDGGSGSGPGEFSGPTGVATDSKGNVYVADYGNHRIQIWGAGSPTTTPPDGPTDVTAEVANGESQATVKFAAPVNNGGSAITGYTVTSSPGGVTATGTGSPITVTALTYGTAYTFTVVATNIVGDSSPSAASNSVTPTTSTAPATVPGAPTDVMAEVANGESQATVRFTAPVSNGGSIITGYTVTSSPDGVTATGTGSPITVTGLTYGTAYTFTVVAINGVGSSADSALSNRVMPTAPAIPGAPTSVTAFAGNGKATVTFATPASNGGSPIIGYTVTASPGGRTVTSTGSPVTVTGLTNGITYTFTVIATNSVGNSPVSEVSNAIRPEAPTDNNNNSGSASSQPASPTTSEPDKTGANVLVNGKWVSAGTIKVTNVNSQTVTTVTIDQDKLEENLAKESQSAVVTIPVNTRSDVVIGELNGQMVSKMELQQAVLEIKTDKATYHLPAQQINIQSISDQVGKSVALKDIKVQIEIAVPKAPVQWVPNESTEGTIAIIVPPLNFTVRALYKDTTIEVTEFKAYVERTIVIPDGVDPNKITTGVVIEADGTLRHVPTKIVLLDGKYSAKVNSLTNSTYSVIWHPLEFKDAELHWAKKAVNDMGSRMVINGVGNGFFNPDHDITRAEFAAILIRGLGLKPKAEAASFSDVDRKDWSVSAIGTAFTYHLISGFEDGTFRPNDKITREQAMTIMARAMTITGLEAKPSQITGQLLDSFTDAGTISNWSKSGISYCLQSEIVSGRNSTELAPKAFITRAEVAVIVQRLLQKSDLI